MMKASISDQQHQALSSAQAREPPRNPALLCASKYAYLILQALGYALPILTAGVYFHCYFYQEREKAVCRWEGEKTMIILSVLIMVWWPVNNALSYYAHCHVRKPTK
ncbi:hypothetical protein ASPWEDRAFT_618524 [Aspergillus wentii DTO 134E9]|uniref:Uncharacterized protein n=1 Tax=Aspergillus wentii DTO 134E9 TaxID=1073089 RepID=A0A1L9REF9_ASPWE|nr:uncharacterized protein ASPWEDRAFT_618524 [Aspergillus wentii DTO 134E9]OJJ33294.1 hypothetical protein ASPWEDRAFT_618524 [Aspergillus wentii DTO 134E9]